MQVVFGFLDAMHHIFVKGSREIQALETECEIWHDPETLPQQEQQRGYISHCLLAWYSLFSQGSSTGWYLPVRKGKYLLLVSFGTGSSIAAPSGIFLRDWSMQWWNKTPTPFLCMVQTEPGHKHWNESSAEAWNCELIRAQASVCKVSICPQTNGKRKSRAPRQLLVKPTNSSPDSLWCQSGTGERHPGSWKCWLESTVAGLSGHGCAITTTKQSLFWWCFGEIPSPHSNTWAVFPSLFQAVTLDGADLTTEVFYKGGHDYQFLCHGKEQTGEGCHNYRVRFLCGKSGTCPISESQDREQQKSCPPMTGSFLVSEQLL